MDSSHGRLRFHLSSIPWPAVTSHLAHVVEVRVDLESSSDIEQTFFPKQFEWGRTEKDVVGFDSIAICICHQPLVDGCSHRMGRVA